MIWVFFVLVALVVVVGFAAVLTGRYTPDPMADPVTSTPHHGLPPGRVHAADLEAVRFDTALRGYRMDQVDEVVDRLQQRLTELEDEGAAGGDRPSPAGRPGPLTPGKPPSAD